MKYFVFGLALIALAIAMLLLARPRNGESAPFLKAWVFIQAYVLTLMTSGLTGVTLVIRSWPF
jgi:hypothetical protein